MNLTLPWTQSVIVEYIWIGGSQELRSKARVLTVRFCEDDFDELPESCLLDIPEWNYDGSSTGQASGDDSEVIIRPKAIYRNPYQRSPPGFLVMCDTYNPDGSPHTTNTRHQAVSDFDTDLQSRPWYGLEQEYFLLKHDTKTPLGYADYGTTPTPEQGQYYCSVGADNAFGREIANEHMVSCIRAGVKISGINAEVAPGQWEFQVGPCEGIKAGDDLWIARYLLQLIAEYHNVLVTLEPKPLRGAQGEWNGSGCHTNFSTVNMREGTKDMSGLDHIYSAIDKLSHKHDEHMLVYGVGNILRMTGGHETSSFQKFTHGIADRGTSVRIGNAVVAAGKGYFEDRRPSSNCDPYVVTSKIFTTISDPM